MRELLRVGLIGLGAMGRIHANNLIQHIPNVDLVAVADPHIHAIEDREFSLPKTVRRFVDYRDMLGLEIDAYVVASATNTHQWILETLLPSKAAIFCEKPLATSLEDAIAIHRALTTQGIAIQVGFMRRFDPLYQRAKELIDAGEIGRPYHYWGLSRDQFAPPVDTVATSGGFCVDTGVHEFDMAQWLLGDSIASVFARGGLFVSRELAALNDYDQVDISFQTQDGRLGLVELSRNAIYGYDIRTEILGERGAIQVVSGPRTNTVLLLENRVVSDTYRNYAERFETAYRQQLIAFFEAVRSGAECPVTGWDAIRAQAVAMAAQRALDSGQVQTVADIEQ
ncbi:MAG: Gfo/Idh/MocA family oxidoreductase [Firmicutes bacterium]|nr:Gfo/Idh/MocA family oxidoreductase [Bacillota bacterium]